MNNEKTTANLKYETPKFIQVAKLPFQVRHDRDSVGIWDSDFKYLAKIMIGDKEEGYTDAFYIANKLTTAVNAYDSLKAENKKLKEENYLCIEEIKAWGGQVENILKNKTKEG